jgi:hypothetical protein
VTKRQLIALALAAAVAGCAGNAFGAAQATADSTTKAVYANDPNAMTSNFDDALKKQVTRAEVGTISDQMHKLGDYKGLTLLKSDTTKNEFTYRADFATGSMNVVIRLDPDGKLAAYRVVPKN